MTVRIYTKEDKVKSIEADIPIIEMLLIRDALAAFYKDETNNQIERDIALQMILDLNPENATLIEIEELS